MDRFPDLVRETAERGHEIGNHTYSHGTRHDGATDLMRDISECEEAVYKACGAKTRLFRPPGGVKEGFAGEVTSRLSYRYVMWTVDTRDWDRTPAERIVKTVLERAKDGSIVLFHDFTCDGCHTYEALSALLPSLIEQGYEFVTVSELSG